MRRGTDWPGHSPVRRRSCRRSFLETPARSPCRGHSAATLPQATPAAAGCRPPTGRAWLRPVHRRPAAHRQTAASPPRAPQPSARGRRQSAAVWHRPASAPAAWRSRRPPLGPTTAPRSPRRFHSPATRRGQPPTPGQRAIRPDSAVRWSRAAAAPLAAAGLSGRPAVRGAGSWATGPRPPVPRPALPGRPQMPARQPCGQVLPPPSGHPCAWPRPPSRATRSPARQLLQRMLPPAWPPACQPAAPVASAPAPQVAWPPVRQAASAPVQQADWPPVRPAPWPPVPLTAWPGSPRSVPRKFVHRCSCRLSFPHCRRGRRAVPRPPSCRLALLRSSWPPLARDQPRPPRSARPPRPPRPASARVPLRLPRGPRGQPGRAASPLRQ